MPAVIFITRVLRMVLQHRGTVSCHYIKQRKRFYIQMKLRIMKHITKKILNVVNENINTLFCLSTKLPRNSQRMVHIRTINTV